MSYTNKDLVDKLTEICCRNYVDYATLLDNPFFDPSTEASCMLGATTLSELRDRLQKKGEGVSAAFIEGSVAKSELKFVEKIPYEQLPLFMAWPWVSRRASNRFDRRLKSGI